MAAVQNNQGRPICNALNLPDKSKKFSTVIVQVLRKDDVKIGQSGKKYQNYVLTDMEGTMIGAVAHEPNINKFNRLMQPYDRYYLSNAFIKEANPVYRIGDYGYGWTLTNYTHVELIEDAVPYSIPCDFNFIKFSELYKWIEHNEPIAIRCLVIHSIPTAATSSKSKTTDYVVVDEEGIAMLIHVWGDLVDNNQNQVSVNLPDPTMAVFINVKVTTHHGLSLATKTNGSVFHNPPLPTKESLLEWFHKNSEVVGTLLKEETYKNTDVLLPVPSSAAIMSVADALASIDQLKVAWISGTLQLVPAQERLWYPACQNCNKSVSQYITWEFTCTSCGVKAPIQTRCRVEFYLTDASGTLCVTLFSHEAEKLIGYTAAHLKASDEKNISFVKDIEAAVYKKPVICFIKRYDKAFRGNNVQAHTALKVYLQAESSDDVAKNANSLIVCEGASSKKKVTVQDTASDQLFSPTTKNILEEISDMSSHDESASSLPTVKRALFHPKESQVSIEPSMKTVVQNVPSQLNVDTVEKPLQSASEVNPYTINAAGKKVAASSGLESPIKKSKSKEKEC